MLHSESTLTGERALRATAPGPDPRCRALAALGEWLAGNGYAFTAVTPETHRLVASRPQRAFATSLRDVFGWSLPFPLTAAPVPDDVIRLLDYAGELERDGSLARSRVRFSSLDGGLFVHSAWPTTAADGAFFGPDTCRFAALIERELSARPLRAGATIVDVACGSGAGGLFAAKRVHAPRLLLADINPHALHYAAVNAELAGVTCAFAESDLLQAIGVRADLIVANPPYLVDAAARTYRHGGGELGAELSLRIVEESLPRLAPGGRLILYTGSPIVAGEDRLRAALEPLLREHKAACAYAELDPDVFGEELSQPAYANADRIAVVGLVVRAPGAPSP